MVPACVPPSLAGAACPLRCVPVAPSDPLQTDDVTGRPRHWVLSLVCRDEPGIVHAISGAIVEAGGNITESQQFSSADTGRFFMRLQVEAEVSHDGFAARLEPLAQRFGIDWRLDVVGRPLRTLVLASTAAHCVNDLLFRQRSGYLPVDIPLVLSNHPVLAELSAFYGVPFESHTVQDAEGKAAFEARVLNAVDDLGIELVVLARYMQIL